MANKRAAAGDKTAAANQPTRKAQAAAGEAKAKKKSKDASKASSKAASKAASKASSKAAKAPAFKPLKLTQGVHQWHAQGGVSADSPGLFGFAHVAGLALPVGGALLRLMQTAQAAATATAAGKAASIKPAAPARKTPVASAVEQVPAQLVELAGNLVQLHARLRLLRLQREAVTSTDTMVLRPSADAAPDSAELQAVSAIRQGQLGQLMRQTPAGGTAAKTPRLNVVARLDGSLVVRAAPAALMVIRHASPGLKMFPATYAYPQRIMALGEELEGAQIQVAAGIKVKKFSVLVQDAAGQPVVGVKVKALVDWDGAHISATSNDQGLAEFGLPTVYPEVVLIMVEPEHTHWSLYLNGFKKSDAPKVAIATLRSLLPDAFKLLGHYAPYDADAGQGVTVGVIDSGVGPHDDLSIAGGACLVTGEDETDFADNGIGHGTHVAGIIAARQSGGGTYGLAPAVRLLAYRVCPQTGHKGRASSTDIAAAIERAVNDGCDLINISMGSVEAMPEVPDMLALAREAGVVVMAATGNDGHELLRYPGRYSHALAVGALGRDQTFPEDSPVSTHESEIRRKSEWVAEFSNYGVGTDFIGPGVAVLSTFPGSRYAMMSGTSMATPFTTGMAARLLSESPSLLNMSKGPERADAIIQMLMEHVRKPGWADIYGFGVLK